MRYPDALRTVRLWQMVGVLVVAAALPFGCGPEGCGESAAPGSGGEGGSAPETGGSGGGDCGFDCGGGDPGPALQIVPASATIEVVDGVVTAFDFNATLDGQPVEPSWLVDLTSVASVDAAGVVSPIGTLGVGAVYFIIATKDESTYAMTEVGAPEKPPPRLAAKQKWSGTVYTRLDVSKMPPGPVLLIVKVGEKTIPIGRIR